MDFISITPDSPYLDSVRKLYESAFPEEERMPFESLFTLQQLAAVDFVAYVNNGRLLGFTYVYHQDDISWLFYFAVDPSQRGHGVGSQILTKLLEGYSGRRIIIDIEDDEQEADNGEQRRRRCRFYKRMGFVDYGVRRYWEPVRYNIMAYGGQVTIDDYNKLIGKLRALLNW